LKTKQHDKIRLLVTRQHMEVLQRLSKALVEGIISNFRFSEILKLKVVFINDISQIEFASNQTGRAIDAKMEHKTFSTIEELLKKITEVIK